MPYKHTRRRKRSNKNFVAAPFTVSLALSTLGDDTILEGVVIGPLAEDMFVISVDSQWTLRGNVSGEGPINVGIHHSDYSVAEIEECLDSNLLDPDDKIAVERSRRLVRRVGTFTAIGDGEVLNNGTPIRTKARFVIGDGKSLGFYAYNRSGAILTTGAILTLEGTVFGRWLR